MDPLIARGFITLLLADNQIAEVKAHELTMAPGRYLQAFEICRSAQLVLDPITEDRESRMKAMLEIWQRDNWKKNQIEDKNHEKFCAGKVKTGEWCRCRSYQQEIHEWMDYVDKNWREPLPLPGKSRLSQRVAEKSTKGRGSKGFTGDSVADSVRLEQARLGEVS